MKPALDADYGALSKSLPETGQALWRVGTFQVRQMTLALIKVLNTFDVLF